VNITIKKYYDGDIWQVYQIGKMWCRRWKGTTKVQGSEDGENWGPVEDLNDLPQIDLTIVDLW
jgi:hypothetical protein